jgi:hypothetical protein
MAATYRIVVRGEIDDRFAFLFNGMRMERVEGTTVVTGTVVDQAQLHGYIDRLAESSASTSSGSSSWASWSAIRPGLRPKERGKSDC